MLGHWVVRIFLLPIVDLKILIVALVWAGHYSLIQYSTREQYSESIVLYNAYVDTMYYFGKFCCGCQAKGNSNKNTKLPSTCIDTQLVLYVVQYSQYSMCVVPLWKCCEFCTVLWHQFSWVWCPYSLASFLTATWRLISFLCNSQMPLQNMFTVWFCYRQNLFFLILNFVEFN